MRMRLRAPDEPEAENGYEFGDAIASAPSTPEHTHLPPLDVGSPEYIEERLENLKRRPNWNDYLDQYVEDHPDSGSEDGDFDDISTEDNAGFIRSTLWSLLVVAFAPLLILIAPCLKHKSYGFWPLGCRSMKELFNCALANVIFMVFGLVLLYWTICRELPDVFNLNNTLVKLNVQVDEFQRAADTCHTALLQWERMVAQELCMPVGIDVALLLFNALLLLHYHRQWARYLMAIMAVMFVVDMPTQLYDATFPSPEIHLVDPTFALVDEELLVALDGKNLKPGGSVAWVAYWGCAITSSVDACDKQFASTFEAGNVAVTFKSLDHFIPCYRDPPNPLKAQDYQCFENIRIRVKDMQSIPGWSRTAPQVAVEFQAVKTESTLNEEWDNVEALSFKREEQMDHSIVNPEPREIESSLSTVNIGNALAVGSSSEAYPAKSTELKKNTGTLSEERVAQENESALGRSLEAELGVDNTEAVIIGEEDMEEAEVMIDAAVKMRDIGDELQNALQNDEDALAPVEEALEDLARKVEDLWASSETEAEVEADKPKKHEEDRPGYNIEDPYHSMDELRVEDAVVNEDIMIIDEEELSTMVMVVDEESIQAVLNSDRDLELTTEVEKHTGSRTFEAQSSEASTAGIVEEDGELTQNSGSRTFEAKSGEASDIVEEDGELARNTELSTYESQPEEVSTSTAIAKEEEEVELATKVEKTPEPEPSTHEARPDEVRRSAVLTQVEEELEFATEMEKQSTFEAQSDEVNEEKNELTTEGEKRTERSTFETQSEDVDRPTVAVKEEEELGLMTEVEKHPEPSTYDAQSDEESTPAATAQEEDLTTSSPKEILSTQEDTTSPAKKALSKLSEALSKISDSSGFASAPETISKKQKQSARQGPRSRHTKKNAEPAAADNTAVV